MGGGNGDPTPGRDPVDENRLHSVRRAMLYIVDTPPTKIMWTTDELVAGVQQHHGIAVSADEIRQCGRALVAGRLILRSRAEPDKWFPWVGNANPETFEGA